ncbi:MAG: hypothetical protein IJA58_08205 [Lachnospiraceae bacterium]|nr:hypothetical protein [Lachnospiraceae bacterium]
MRVFSKKINQWLLPAVLILFILEIVTLPYMVQLTYAGRSEEAGHVLTYTEGKLTWDSATGIDENGVACLDLFDAEYEGVSSAEGDNVIAPGTEGFNIVRLHNAVEGAVSFTAVLYRIRTNEALPVEAQLEGVGVEDALEYPLPDRVKEEQVIRAVTGSLPGGQIQDFDITWLWSYFDDEEQDVIDTLLGDRSALDESDRVTIGLYIVVNDGNDYVVPDTPFTGDEGSFGMYLALMCISGILLVILWMDRRRERRCDW